MCVRVLCIEGILVFLTSKSDPHLMHVCLPLEQDGKVNKQTCTTHRNTLAHIGSYQRLGKFISWYLGQQITCVFLT